MSVKFRKNYSADSGNTLVCLKKSVDNYSTKTGRTFKEVRVPLGYPSRTARRPQTEEELASGIPENSGRNQERGKQLDPMIQSRLETALSIDLRDVRIYTGGYAAQVTREQNARAVTIGNDIYFAPGEFNTESEDGMELLLHEIMHTLQYSRQDLNRGRRGSDINDITELERVADTFEKMGGAMSTAFPDTAVTPTLPGPVPAPFPIIETPPSSAPKGAEAGMQKKDGPPGGGSDDPEEQSKETGKPGGFKLILKDGSEVPMTKADIDTLFFAFERKVGEWLRDQEKTGTQGEYEQQIIKFFKVISGSD
ncbi:MAG: DUF4157 domain-containing protein [bacterium]|nr:DUF4157 domain-containing protein [bacterium]